MTKPLNISVIVASRGRPELLLRCLSALDQLIWPSFEVIVVADKAGRDAVACRPSDAPDVKVIACDQANISLARNLGIAAAGGDLVAFVDDDAVAEPMWLAALADAFRDSAVGAATGPVLGRNGISLQYGAETVLLSGETVSAQRDPVRRRASGDRFPKTVGTNMAFRADVLRSVGGFDESYRYLFEDADLNVRLGQIGVLTAYVPFAVVHHASAQSKRRRQDRAPRDLFDIGRSTAIFLDRHSGANAAHALSAARQREFQRLDRDLVSGKLEPRDVRRLRKSFDEGVVKAQAKDTAPKLNDFEAAPPFRPRAANTWHQVAIGSSFAKRHHAMREAQKAREAGAIATLIVLSLTGLYHRVSYEDGIWIQRGGTFGRSDRAAPLFRITPRRRRFELEVARVSTVRGVNSKIDAQSQANCVVTTTSLSFF